MIFKLNQAVHHKLFGENPTYPTPNYSADPIAAEDVEAWLKEACDFTLYWDQRCGLFTAKSGEIRVTGHTRPLTLCRLALEIAKEDK